MKRILRLTKTIDSKSVDAVLSAFREIFSEASKILYDKDKSYLTYQVISGEGFEESSQIYKGALSLEKEPVEVAFGKDKKDIVNTIFDIFHVVNQKGLFISHILVSDLSRLDKWLDKSGARTIFNIRVQQVDEIEKDVILFIASANKQAEIEDFRLVIKGNIDI